MALRSVLLSAALPGGRSEWSDPGFSDEHAQEPTLMDGLPRNAFELWERSNGPLGLNTHHALQHLATTSARQCGPPSLDATHSRIENDRGHFVVKVSWHRVCILGSCNVCGTLVPSTAHDSQGHSCLSSCTHASVTTKDYFHVHFLL